MSKYIITFGHGQLVEYPVDPLSVALIIEANTVEEARAQVFLSPIGTKFCTHYPYDEYIDKFRGVYGMTEYTMSELMGLANE